MKKYAVSKLSSEQKTDAVFERIDEINKWCFEGVERPPAHVFEQTFRRADVYVAWVGPTIVGFAFVTEKNFEPFLWSVAVSPAYQGTGVATSILGDLEAISRDRKKHFIELTCKIDNATAIRIYLKSGYRIRTILKGHYGVEGDGLLLRRSL